MRLKVFMLIWAAVMIIFPASSGFARDRFLVFYTGNYLLPVDRNYKNIYGNSVLYPELIIGSGIYKKVSLWIGFGMLKEKRDAALDLKNEARSLQDFLSCGVRYSGELANSLTYKLDLGLLFVVYKQENIEAELNGSALGFRTDSGIVYSLSRNLFMEISVGYLLAADRVKDVAMRWGGLKGGVGIGIWF